jgi:hypothetical protein
VIAKLSFILVLTVLAACAHQSDDDYPIRHGKIPETVAPPAVPPAAPQPLPTPSPSAPLVTVPAPPPPSPIVQTNPSPRVAPGTSTPSVKSTPGSAASSGLAVAGALQISDPLSAPVKRLINSAEESLKKGKILEARSQADRAYRMDLRDPRTSFLMARVAEKEKSYEDAEQWAMRSLEYLGDSKNKLIVWNFVAKVREKSGNKKGVQEAMRKVNELKR